jgi:hypothetical protein
MIMRDPTVWRSSHTRQHTDTLILGRDPEIAAMRPARLARLLANFFGLVDVPLAFGLMFLHASGRQGTWCRCSSTSAPIRPGLSTARSISTLADACPVAPEIGCAPQPAGCPATWIPCGPHGARMQAMQSSTTMR